METEKPLLGMPVVVALTFAIMRLTPARFDKTRFAIPISLIVAIVLSVADTLVYSQGDVLKGIYESVLKGVGLGFAAVGAHSAYKNYTPDNNNE